MSYERHCWWKVPHVSRYGTRRDLHASKILCQYHYRDNCTWYRCYQGHGDQAILTTDGVDRVLEQILDAVCRQQGLVQVVRDVQPRQRQQLLEQTKGRHLLRFVSLEDSLS